MKNKLADKNSNCDTRRFGVVILAFLVVTVFALGHSVAQNKSQKRITSLQAGESAAGSRVSVFSDSSMGDYEAFRRGDRFYVKVPLAEFAGAQPNLRGDGFEDVQIQRVGDSIVISFKLQPGVNARVDPRSNRLDIYFSATRMRQATNLEPERSRGMAAPIPGIVTLPTARNHERNPDVAGPMPTDTPTANRPRLATSAIAEARQTAARIPQPGVTEASTTAEPIRKSNNESERVPSKGTQTSNSSPWTTTSTSAPSSNFTSSATPSYQTSATTIPPSVAQSPQSVTSLSQPSVPLSKRLEAVQLWASSHRVAVIIGALVILGLMVLGVSMAYRKRVRKVKTSRHKVPGVQPTYHPDDEMEHVFEDEATGDYEMLFEEQASASHSDPELTTTASSGRFSPFQNEDNEWADLEPVMAQPSTDTRQRSVSTEISDFPMTITNEEHEREVFEL